MDNKKSDQELGEVGKLHRATPSVEMETHSTLSATQPTTCRMCGTKLRRSDWGGVVYTTIAPHLGLCIDCINRATC